jgi:CBS domain-containing protein
MTLATHKRLIEKKDGPEHELVVACPQRIDPVPLEECARCELCEGLDLDGHVSVRCAVGPENARDGTPGAQAPVTSIMTSPVVSVEEDASIENVQWLLLQRGIGAVPVVDRLRRPIGILAKTDLLRERDEPALSADLRQRATHGESGSSEREVSGLRASDLMTPVVHAVLERMSIAATAELMARERVHHAVVVTATGEIAGIVSTLDIARWVAARERFVPRET